MEYSIRAYNEPCLLFPYDDNRGSLCTISSPYMTTHINLPNLGGKGIYCLNCCYGWLLISDYHYKQITLWNPRTSKVVYLPKLRLNSKQWISSGILKLSGLKATMMTDNLDDDSAVLLFDGTQIIYCRLGDHRWFSVFYGKEYDGHGLHCPVNWNGSVYAITTRTLFSIDPKEVDPIKPICELPYYHGYRIHHMQYLVQCNGELFYIGLEPGRGDLFFDVIGIEVFKFDHINLEWKRVGELGDKVFFLDCIYAIGCPTDEGEIEGGGHIYLNYFKHLYKFNIHDNTLSISFLLGVGWNIEETYCPPFWVMPDMRLVKRHVQDKIDVREQRGSNEEKETREDGDMGKHEESCPLYYLLDDVLGVILRCLKNPIDYINFRSVSRKCLSSAPLLRWQEESDKFDSTTLEAPWVMFIANNPNIHNFIDPRLGGNKYLMNVPESLVEAKIRYSRNGWLLMSRLQEEFVFYHPLTKTIIGLPQPPRGSVSRPVVCFSSLPTNLDYTIVVIGHVTRTVDVYFYSRERQEWDQFRFGNDNEDWEFIIDHHSPAFYNGSIYVLSENGNLGELRFSDDGECHWTILDKPEKPFHDEFFQKFLVECDGRLLSIFVGYLEDWVRVFALNTTAMSWERVESLETYTLYLSRSSCLWKRATTSDMGNKIFVTRYHDDSVVYYSLETGKYHSLSSNDAVLDYYNSTREQLEACWFEPSW